MNTSHQFVLCSANPERERVFREKKAAAAKKYGGKGSFYAFHGYFHEISVVIPL